MPLHENNAIESRATRPGGAENAPPATPQPRVGHAGEPAEPRGDPFRILARRAWWPIPVLLAAMLGLWTVDLRDAYVAPPSVSFTLQFVFMTLASTLVAYLVARSFLARGVIGLLLLGCGVVSWGLSGAVAGFLGRDDFNVSVTIHNLCVWLSAFCHLTGVILHGRPQRTLYERGWWLLAGYGATAVAVALVASTAAAGWTPTFFVQGEGGTPVRQIVLGSAILMFALSAFVLLARNRRERSSFIQWYGLALLLFAVGLFGVFIQSVHSSVLGWTGIGTQWLGGVYLFVAALAAARESRAWETSLAVAPHDARLRYCLAAAFVLAAVVVRLVFPQIVGAKFPYLIFYPAVILAALYGGRGPGLLATVLAAITVNFFWIEPVGRLSPGEASDWLGMVLFLGISGGMVFIIDAMQQAQARFNAAEAELKFAVERQRAGAALRASEERLRLAMESAGMGTWDVDLRTGEAVWSENRFRLFGYAPAPGGRATMEMWRSRVHPDDLPGVMRALETARRERSLYAPDHRIVRADDGRIVWLRVAGRFHYDDAGEAIRFAGVTFDNTARKQAELALRESEQRERERAAELEALLEAVPAAVWIAHDPDCHRVTGNRAANALLRLDTGQEASLTAPGPERPTHFKVVKDGRELTGDELPVQRAARGHAVHHFEHTVLFTDGSARHLLGNAWPLHDERGEPRGSVAAFVDITERKQTEEALRVSEARFRSYFELGLIGMAITSPEKGILEVNDEICKILGYERSELLRTTWAELTHPDDLGADSAQFNRVIAGEIDGYSLEKRWIRKDGAVILTTVSVKCVRRVDGSVDYFVALLQDITERRRAEEALRESEKRLSYALEATTEGLWDWNIQTGTVHFSPHWIEALGYSPDVPPHVSFWQGIIHPDDVARVRQALEAHFAGRTPLYICENRLRLKSGEYRWNLDRGKVVEWDADGVPLRMVGTDTDITGRKRAEHAQAQLAAIVESNSDAIISRGLDRTILSWNPAAERLFGWTAKEAIGQSIRLTTPPEVWGTRDALIERVRRGEKVGSVETVRVRKDGTRFLSETIYSPVRDAQGNVVSIATVIRDISERKQAERVLRDYTERQESLSRKLVQVQEKERAAIARELHDQIGQVLGAAKLGLQLSRRRSAAAPLRAELDESISAIDQALQQTRTLSLELRPPQLDDLGLATALRLYAERLAAASAVKLHFAPAQVPALPPQLDTTCFRVAQEALQNVIRHASAQNIWIELAAADGVLHLKVSDDGGGCDLPAVRQRAREGGSIGLLNMEERVALAGGTIELQSDPGKGMSIHAAFPLSTVTISPDKLH